MDDAAAKKRRKRYLDKGEPFVVPLSTAYGRKKRGRDRALMTPAECLVDSSDSTQQFDASPVLAQRMCDTGAESSSAAVELDLQGEENGCDPTIPNPSPGDENESGDEASASWAVDEEEDGERAVLDEAELFASDFAHLGEDSLPGSTTTKAAAVVIMAFVITYNLTWVALGDLLRLVDALFGFKGNVIPRSKYLFRKLWASKTASIGKSFFYCQICATLLDPVPGTSRMKCDSCLVDEDSATLKARGNYFVIFDLKEHVKHLIARAKDFLFENLLRLKQDTEQGFCALVKDITSGFVLRNLRESRQVKWCDLTITVNTDGSPVFKSSTSSVWPIQFVINELPPDYRLKNFLVGGLCFGKHPEMTVFLKKFVDELNEFGEVIWKKGSTVITSSLYAVCSCVDVPARALVSSGAYCSGFFGCSWCYAPGEHVGGTLLLLEYYALV
ncbi:uncharacterized protein LOC144168044 [Haemaphysalis longicornis]